MSQHFTSKEYYQGLVLSNFNSVVPPSTTLLGTAVPCVGLILAYGIVYSSLADVTVVIEQGSNDTGGILNFRHTNSVIIPAGDATMFSAPIRGRFIRVNIVNSGIGSPSVETFVQMSSSNF